MLTKPVSFNISEQSPIALTGRCKLFYNGTEHDVSLVTSIYLVIQLVRKRIPHEVFYEDGRLLLRHDGEASIERNQGFEDALSVFSEFFLEEQRLGYALYEAALKAEAEKHQAS